MSVAPIFLPRGQAGFNPSGDLLVSTGLSVPDTNAIPSDQLAGLRASMGLPPQGGMSVIAGFGNTFFRVRAANVTAELATKFPIAFDQRPGVAPPPQPPPQPPPDAPPVDRPHSIAVGSVVQFISEPGPEWIVTFHQGHSSVGEPLYRLMDWPNPSITLERQPQFDLFVTVPAEASLLDSLIKLSEGAIRTDISETRKEIQGVPTATAEFVGPLIKDSESRLKELIFGIVVPDISDLIGLVPALAQFLTAPLDFLLTQGGGISPEVRDSVRSK